MMFMGRVAAVSERRLTAAFPDLAFNEIQSIQALMRVTLTPEDVDRTLELVNKLLNAYGIEAIRDGDWEEYYLDIGVLYVNMGDTYDTTILFDTRTERYLLSSWGDYVESRRSRFR